MKKLLQLILFAAAFIAVLTIPDKTDRLYGIIVYALVFGSLAVFWASVHRDLLLFLLLAPVFALIFFAKRAWKELRDYNERTKLTPEEEREAMNNHFDEPWGIGAW